MARISWRAVSRIHAAHHEYGCVDWFAYDRHPSPIPARGAAPVERTAGAAGFEQARRARAGRPRGSSLPGLLGSKPSSPEAEARHV